MYRSVVDYMFKNMFLNFLYSTGGAPKRRGAQSNLPFYSSSQRAWVH